MSEQFTQRKKMWYHNEKLDIVFFLTSFLSTEIQV